MSSFGGWWQVCWGQGLCDEQTARSRKRQWKGQWPVISLFLRHIRMWHSYMWFARGLLPLQAASPAHPQSKSIFIFSLVLKKRKKSYHTQRDFKSETLITSKSGTSKLQFPQQQQLCAHLQFECYCIWQSLWFKTLICVWAMRPSHRHYEFEFAGSHLGEFSGWLWGVSICI